MPAVPITAETLPEFERRLKALTPESQRRFGSLSVDAMLRHMRNAFEASLGLIEVPDATHPQLGRGLYYLFCYAITTWPGGKIKAPDWWTPAPEQAFEAERGLLLQRMEEFTKKAGENPDLVHMNPFFGPMTMRKWSRLNGIHLHHHLRQFGV